jgi:hypothetical protein
MGQCVSAKKSSGASSFMDSINPSVEEFGPCSTQPLDFVLHLSNVKLKDAPYESMSCKIVIEGSF